MKASGLYRYFAAAAFMFAMGAAQGQSFSRLEWNDAGIPSLGMSPRRTEFMSYDTRGTAEKGGLADSPYYLPLKLEYSSAGENPVILAKAEIPYMWLDRQVFLHVEGFTSYYLKVNGRTIGYGEDSRLPSEFNLSRWITDGDNELEFELMPKGTGIGLEAVTEEPALPVVYIWSQPMVRIDDFRITTEPDSTGGHYILTARVVLSNSYNSDEELIVGYDIYDPKNQLVYYDMKEAQLKGGGRDTLEFVQPIYGDVMKNLWSAENPALYNFLFSIKYDNRMIEYIPCKVGFGTTELSDGAILRNGKPVAIRAVNYNADEERAVTDKDLAALKKKGYNTVCPDYPQPVWFYDACERLGLYVIEQANINSTFRTHDRSVGGAYSNDPAWLGSFTERAAAPWLRSKNRPCIVGWSLGGSVGNGYNMYKAYLRVKELETVRPVIFNDANGEWNTDMAPVPADNGAAILGKQPPVAAFGG